MIVARNQDAEIKAWTDANRMDPFGLRTLLEGLPQRERRSSSPREICGCRKTTAKK